MKSSQAKRHQGYNNNKDGNYRGVMPWSVTRQTLANSYPFSKYIPDAEHERSGGSNPRSGTITINQTKDEKNTIRFVYAIFLLRAIRSFSDSLFLWYVL